jgi:hypothetical protein
MYAPTRKRGRGRGRRGQHFLMAAGVTPPGFVWIDGQLFRIVSDSESESESDDGMSSSRYAAAVAAAAKSDSKVASSTRKYRKIVREIKSKPIDYQSQSLLIRIPQAVLQQVMMFLNIRYVAGVMPRVCKTIYTTVNHESFWHIVAIHRMQIRTKRTSRSKWCTLVKERYRRACSICEDPNAGISPYFRIRVCASCEEKHGYAAVNRGTIRRLKLSETEELSLFRNIQKRCHIRGIANIVTPARQVMQAWNAKFRDFAPPFEGKLHTDISLTPKQCRDAKIRFETDIRNAFESTLYPAILSHVRITHPNLESPALYSKEICQHMYRAFKNYRSPLPCQVTLQFPSPQPEDWCFTPPLHELDFPALVQEAGYRLRSRIR